MSHRTIIEVNHDYIEDIATDPVKTADFLRKLMWNDWGDGERIHLQGVRKLGERHHSDTLKLTVK